MKMEKVQFVLRDSIAFVANVANSIGPLLFVIVFHQKIGKATKHLEVSKRQTTTPHVPNDEKRKKGVVCCL
jgi:hypothetical protein